MAKFHIGQMVYIIESIDIAPEARFAIGSITTITGLVPPPYWAITQEQWYELELNIQGIPINAAERILRPINDGDPSRDQKTTWDEFKRTCGIDPSKVPELVV